MLYIFINIISGTDTLVWGDLSQFKEDSICDTYWDECER